MGGNTEPPVHKPINVGFGHSDSFEAHSPKAGSPKANVGFGQSSYGTDSGRLSTTPTGLRSSHLRVVRRPSMDTAALARMGQRGSTPLLAAAARAPTPSTPALPPLTVAVPSRRATASEFPGLEASDLPPRRSGPATAPSSPVLSLPRTRPPRLLAASEDNTVLGRRPDPKSPRTAYSSPQPVLDHVPGRRQAARDSASRGGGPLAHQKSLPSQNNGGVNAYNNARKMRSTNATPAPRLDAVAALHWRTRVARAKRRLYW